MNIGTISNVHSFKNVLPQGISMYLSEHQMFPIARYYLLELPKIIPWELPLEICRMITSWWAESPLYFIILYPFHKILSSLMV